VIFLVLFLAWLVADDGAELNHLTKTVNTKMAIYEQSSIGLLVAGIVLTIFGLNASLPSVRCVALLHRNAHRRPCGCSSVASRRESRVSSDLRLANDRPSFFIS
jgi:hypothetical protein